MNERKPMLFHGNQHLGRDFWTFSLPARETCPGATLACLMVCYALGFVFLTKSSLTRHTENWDRAKATEEFARDIILEIRYRRIRMLRVHVAGDFFSADYVRAWTRIARRCKTTRFLFYTRSWRVPEMREALVELAGLPNVSGFWSEDRDTGPCDLPVGRRCYLATTIQDELLVPPGVLVFREVTREPRKFINGSWVCAKEQGTRAGVTCSSCLQCVKDDPWPVEPKGRGRDGSASVTPGIEGTSA